MRRTDIAAVADIAGLALAAGGGLVEQMHDGIAGRPLGILGEAAAPVRVLHDGIAGAVYAGVRTAFRAAARAGGALAAETAADDGPALGNSGRGAVAVAALNALHGDLLARRGSPLALEMTIRRRGADVAPAPDALRAAFPDATPRVAVLVHGLGETDSAWRLFAGRDPERRTYGERLRDDLGFTALHLRYNTGLHVSANGLALAALLDDVVAAWPVAVEELVLVGHSMGGLVARSAAHYGAAGGRAWTDAVRHVFCLGTPHLGADLEKGVAVVGSALRRVPETRALAAVLDARSDGIKDLRHGACVEEDWPGCDPDEVLRDRCTDVPFLPHAAYYFVGATVREGPLGTLLGDLLVRMPSASGRGSGRGRRIPFEVANGRELSGLTHLDLLNHPAVYEQLRAWIERAPVRTAGIDARG